MSERVPPACAAVLPPTPDELEHLRPLVRRLVWDPSQVDDVLQEVWLAGQRGLAGIAAGARRSWLATTARRIAGHRRRQACRGTPDGERSPSPTTRGRRGVRDRVAPLARSPLQPAGNSPRESA